MKYLNLHTEEVVHILNNPPKPGDAPRSLEVIDTTDLFVANGHVYELVTSNIPRGIPGYIRQQLVCLKRCDRLRANHTNLPAIEPPLAFIPLTYSEFQKLLTDKYLPSTEKRAAFGIAGNSDEVHHNGGAYEVVHTHDTSLGQFETALRLRRVYKQPQSRHSAECHSQGPSEKQKLEEELIYWREKAHKRARDLEHAEQKYKEAICERDKALQEEQALKAKLGKIEYDLMSAEARVQIYAQHNRELRQDLDALRPRRSCHRTCRRSCCRCC